MPEALDPPGKIVCLQGVPIVDRIPPKLSCFAEVIGRNSRHLDRIKFVVEVKELRVCPDISAVIMDIDRKIAEKFDLFLVASLPELFHRREEEILTKIQEIHRLAQSVACFSKRVLVPEFEFFWPFVPRDSSKTPLEGGEESVIRKPVLVFP